MIRRFIQNTLKETPGLETCRRPRNLSMRSVKPGPLQSYSNNTLLLLQRRRLPPVTFFLHATIWLSIIRWLLLF
jgi:hypothetical protein